jgi:hypothetical protein
MSKILINVNCANRDEKWNILWIWWKWYYHSKIQAISFIEKWTYDYYVNWKVKVIVKNLITWKYLTTQPDNTVNDNLDNINQCSL